MDRRSILLIPILMALLNLAALLVQVGNPGDTTTPESLLVYCAQRVQHGESLYQDYQHPPYNYMPYTPLYTWVTGAAARWLSLDVNGLFILGRVITFACCLGVAFLLYRRGSWDADSLLCGVSGAALFLSSTLLRQWAVTNRPDIIALLFSLGGFLVYTRFASGTVRLPLALILFACAFFCKPSSLAAPAAVVLSHLLQKHYREAIILFLGVVIPAAGFLLVMHAGTGGLSTLNIIENNAAPMQWINAKLIAVLFSQAAALPLVVAIMGASTRGWKDPQTCYLVTSILLSLVSSSKLGSNVNYYLEPLAAACLLAPAGVRFLADASRGAAILISLVVILSIPSLSIIVYSLQNPGFRLESNVRTLVEETTGPVLTDNPRLALISRDQFFIDPFPFSYLEKQGKWDSKEAISMLDRHEIPLVILTLPVEDSSSWQGAKRLPQSIIDAVIRDYKLQERVDSYCIYIPKE